MKLLATVVLLLAIPFLVVGVVVGFVYETITVGVDMARTNLASLIRRA